MDNSTLNKQDKRAPAIIGASLFAVTVLSRLPFMGRMLYNHDSVQFALALDHYDIYLHQPHPPGYFLYVMLGRLARLLTGDANTGFICISILFSGLAVAFVYLLAREMFDGPSGVAAALICMTSPVFWFYGEVALSYMPEAFMSALVAYLCWRMLNGEKGLYLAAAATLGVAGGFRQNTMLFLMPLWLYSTYRTGLKRTVIAAFVLCGVFLLWFVPMVQMTGGFGRYSSALSSIWLNTVVEERGVAKILKNLKFMVFYTNAGLLLSGVALVSFGYLVIKRKAEGIGARGSLFFLIWLTPALLFYVLVFFEPKAPGYALVYMVGLFVLAGKAVTGTASYISGLFKREQWLTAMALGLTFIMGANSYYFLKGPVPSYRHLRELERIRNDYFNAIRNNFSPENTDIVCDTNFLVSFRFIQYYLPGYRVFNTFANSKREVFWSRNGKTMISDKIRNVICERNNKVVEFWWYRPEQDGPAPPGARLMPVSGGLYLIHYDGWCAPYFNCYMVGQFFAGMEKNYPGYDFKL